MIGAGWLPTKLAIKNDEAEPSTNALLSDSAKNTEYALALRVSEPLEGKNKNSAEARGSLVEQALKAA